MTGTLAEFFMFACFLMLQLSALAILWIVTGLQAEVARLTKVAGTPENTALWTPLHEFEELQKLVYSQNHIIRALHDEIEELQKKGGGKSNTTNVRPRSHARVRNVQKR